MKGKSLHAQGLVFFKAKKYEMAIPYFQQAIEQDPLISVYYEALGDAYSYLQSTLPYAWVDAIRNWTDALLLDPARLYLQAQVKTWTEGHASQNHARSALQFTSELSQYHSCHGYCDEFYYRERIIQHYLQGINAARYEDYSQAAFYLGNADAVGAVNFSKDYEVTFTEATSGYVKQFETKRKQILSDLYNTPSLNDLGQQNFNGYSQIPTLHAADAANMKKREMAIRLLALISRGLVYSKCDNNSEKAKAYLCAALTNIVTIDDLQKSETLRNDAVLVAEAFYELGLISKKEGNSEAAIENFEQALLFGKRRACVYLAIQQERSLFDVKLRNTLASFDQVHAHYHEQRYVEVVSFCNDAQKVGRRIEATYLYRAMARVRLYQYHYACQDLEQFLSLAKDNAAQGDFFTAAVELKKLMEAWQADHYHYLANHLHLLIYWKALGKVMMQGELSEEKRVQLIKFLEQKLTQQEGIRSKFFRYDYHGILVEKVSEAIAKFMKHKPIGKAGPGLLHVHFSIKVKQILTDRKFIEAAEEAIAHATRLVDERDLVRPAEISLNTSTGTGDIKPSRELLLESLANLEHVIYRPSPISSTEQNATTSSVSEARPKPRNALSKAVAAKIVVTTLPSPALPPRRVSTSPKVDAESQQRRKEQEMQDLHLQHKAQIKQEAAVRLSEFSDQLAILKESRANGSMDLRTLNKKYQELEAQAVQLKEVSFFVARGDFYFESAENEANSTRKHALCNNALQDYQHAMKYDPFLDGVPERIEKIANQLKPAAPQSGEPKFFARKLPPPPPRVNIPQTLPTRDALNPEQLKELEALKARLRGQSPNK